MQASPAKPAWRNSDIDAQGNSGALPDASRPDVTTSTDLEVCYMWQWEHRSGWRPYDEKSQEMIEQAYRRGFSKVRLKTGKGKDRPMEIFFADLRQWDPISDNVRGVRRVGRTPWWLPPMRFMRGMAKWLETGAPRNESFHDHQVRRQLIESGEAAQVKKISQRLWKDLDEAGLYKTGSCAATLAQTQAFFTVSMIMVVLNAVFVAIDVDHNPATVITKAEPYFMVVEYLFCAFFFTEISIRFVAFSKKSFCLYDPWFIFDTLLVILMLLESCVLPIVVLFSSSDNPPNFGGSLSVLRTLRLLRLTKVFRAVPQLLTLVKGITAALSSVLFTMVLLVVLLFVFGVVFASQTKDKATECNMSEEVRWTGPNGDVDRCQSIETLFGSVTQSSWSLLLHGTLLDSPSMVTSLFWDNRVSHLAWAFLLFIFLSSFTVLNMLIGIVCEVVSKVSKTEKEEQEARFLKNNLLNILECYDKDDDKSIGPEEFTTFFKNPEVRDHLARFGTKVQGVESLKQVLFEESSKLTFPELLEVIMRLRGENKAEVTDIMELREFIRQCHMETRDFLRSAAGLVGGDDTDRKLAPSRSKAFLTSSQSRNLNPNVDQPPKITIAVSQPVALTAVPSSGSLSNESTWEAVLERLDRIENMCSARKERDAQLQERLGQLEEAVVWLSSQLSGADIS